MTECYNNKMRKLSRLCNVLLRALFVPRRKQTITRTKEQDKVLEPTILNHSGLGGCLAIRGIRVQGFYRLQFATLRR